MLVADILTAYDMNVVIKSATGKVLCDSKEYNDVAPWYYPLEVIKINAIGCDELELIVKGD